MTRNPTTLASAANALPRESAARTARLARSYVNEGLALLGEGVPAAAIEQAAMQAGLPAGPLALLDEMSLEEADRLLHESMHGSAGRHDHPGHDHAGHDRAAHDHGAHGAARSSAAPRPATGAGPAEALPVHGMTENAVYVLEKMAHGFGRLGRDSGRGFYDYEDDEAPELWSGLKVFERRGTMLPAEDVRDRLLHAPVVEALRRSDPAVAGRVGEVPSNRDSPLLAAFGRVVADTAGIVGRTGAQAFAARARELAERYGDRFRLPEQVLRELDAGAFRWQE